MLKIPVDSSLTNKFADNHAIRICNLIRNRFYDYPILRKYFSNDKVVINFLKTSPEKLKSSEEDVIKELVHKGYKIDDIIEESKNIFNYKYFFSKTPKYNAFNLCSNIGLVTCPYCNINLISTIKGLKDEKLILRPPLDHFYCFSKHPLLGLSYFNLIPSCWNCNSIFKLNQETDISTHVHPYLDYFGNKCQLKFTNYKSIDDILSAKTSNYEVYFDYKPSYKSIKGNIDIFNLDIVYNEYKEIFRSVLISSQRYPKEAISGIMDVAKSTKIDTYNLIFQAFFDDSEHHQLPFSKGKSDIFKQYATIDTKSALGKF